MGFVGKLMGNVQNIQIYYILGLLIFIGLFIVILVRTLRMKKSDIVAIKTSIIDQDEQTESMNS
jgi:hypothetical protein